MGQYTKNGLLNGYKKNNKERAELDYYATPTVEVENILNTLQPDFSGKSILEPCVGGGHMLDGIINYCDQRGQTPKVIIGTEWTDRGYRNNRCNLTYGLDFLDDDYPANKVDVIIMNPPYATLEPFLIRALEIAHRDLIVLCRTQALEGASRYKNVFTNNPPDEIYQYIDRIQCWKNGKKPTSSSAQAYCWLVWKNMNITRTAIRPNIKPQLHWIHRAD